MFLKIFVFGIYLLCCNSVFEENKKRMPFLTFFFYILESLGRLTFLHLLAMGGSCLFRPLKLSLLYVNLYFNFPRITANSILDIHCLYFYHHFSKNYFHLYSNSLIIPVFDLMPLILYQYYLLKNFPFQCYYKE